MALYASKTPRDLNHDPTPWVSRVTGRRYSGPFKYGHGQFDYRPSPEYDHAQHNQPNPILLDFRETSGHAQTWIDVIESAEGDAFLAETPKEFGFIDASAIDHAVLVLTRLANLSDK